MRSKNSRKLTKRERVVALALARGWTQAGEAHWLELKRELPGISDVTLRAGLKAAGVVLEQPWLGVEIHTYEELAASLNGLTAIYLTGGSEVRRTARRAVIQAKERARLISRSERVEPAKRAVKAEMVNWMLVWLDAPELFPAWVALRTRNLAASD